MSLRQFSQTVIVLLLFICSVVSAQQFPFYAGSSDELQTQAQTYSVPYLLYFTLPDCTPCERMEKETFNYDPLVRYVERNYLAKRVDRLNFGRDETDLTAQYQVRQFPTVLIVGPDGQIRRWLEGFRSGPELMAMLQKVYQPSDRGPAAILANPPYEETRRIADNQNTPEKTYAQRQAAAPQTAATPPASSTYREMPTTRGETENTNFGTFDDPSSTWTGVLSPDEIARAESKRDTPPGSSDANLPRQQNPQASQESDKQMPIFKPFATRQTDSQNPAAMQSSPSQQPQQPQQPPALDDCYPPYPTTAENLPPQRRYPRNIFIDDYVAAGDGSYPNYAASADNTGPVTTYPSRGQDPVPVATVPAYPGEGPSFLDKMTTPQGYTPPSNDIQYGTRRTSNPDAATNPTARTRGAEQAEIVISVPGFEAFSAATIRETAFALHIGSFLSIGELKSTIEEFRTVRNEPLWVYSEKRSGQHHYHLLMGTYSSERQAVGEAIRMGATWDEVKVVNLNRL